MKILLVSATKSEILPLLKMFRIISSKGNVTSCRFAEHAVDVLITGVGMTAAAFHIGKTLSSKYDLAINAGIAGSFKRKIPLGSVVNVVSDCFADLGAEDGSRFLTAHEMGIGKSGIRNPEFSPKAPIPGNMALRKEISKINKVKGITVNTVHGNLTSIRKVSEKFNPDVESMEGAAFFLACNHEKIPCIQIRAISNYMERRNRKKWKMNLAIENLNILLEKLLKP